MIQPNAPASRIGVSCGALVAFNKLKCSIAIFPGWPLIALNLIGSLASWASGWIYCPLWFSLNMTRCLLSENRHIKLSDKPQPLLCVNSLETDQKRLCKYFYLRCVKIAMQSCLIVTGCRHFVTNGFLLTELRHSIIIVWCLAYPHAHRLHVG